MEDLIENLKVMVNEFDLANFIPAVDSILGWIEMLVRIFVLAAPICILVFGLCFLFLPPKEANHRAGYRTYFGMGSVEAWRFSQRIAGLIFGALGALLLIIMLIVVFCFIGKDLLQIARTAVICLLWQVGLTLIARISICVMAGVYFDKNGNRRR